MDGGVVFYAGKGAIGISMNIYLIRHAQTAKNRQKLLQGRSDEPLNETGEEQSRKAGVFFRAQGIHFDRIWSSPLVRSVRTAQIVGECTQEGCPGIILDDRLLEMDYGPYEGISLENPPKEIIQFFSDFVHQPAPAGMESLDQVKQRLAGFLDDIKEEPCQNVLISLHAISMKGALEVLTPDAGGAYWSKYIGNCSVYRTEYSGGSFSVPEEIFALAYEPGV